MGRIIVCYKWVLDEADLKINPQDHSVDASKAKGKISEYDRNAIAAAVAVGQSCGDEVVALSYGNATVKNSLKDAMSRGPAGAYWVNDPAADEADGFVSSSMLAAAIQRIGDYRLIICGEGAADTYARQVGARVGTLLDIPVITCVCDLKVEQDRLIATRKLEDCVETVSASLPALVTVVPEICAAPIPGLKAVLEAAKKPATELSPAELGVSGEALRPKSKRTGLKAYAANRKQQMINADTADQKVQMLISALKQEGVL